MHIIINYAGSMAMGCCTSPVEVNLRQTGRRGVPWERAAEESIRLKMVSSTRKMTGSIAMDLTEDSTLKFATESSQLVCISIIKVVVYVEQAQCSYWPVLHWGHSL